MAIKTVTAKINGQTYTLTLNSATGKYEATITAPDTSSYKQSGHYYNVELTAIDQAGNSTTKNAADSVLGTSLQLRVREKVAPQIMITYPSAGARIINSKPKITWTVTDNDSGVDPDTIRLTINSSAITSGITKTARGDGTGYDCSYTPSKVLLEGSNTILFDADDHDGNSALQGSVTFTVDTVAPTLSVSAPVEGLATNDETINVIGTTNDATSSPVTVAITVNDVDQGAVTVGAGGAFAKAVSLTSGKNVIKITATDQAGKSTTITRTVILDMVAPVFNSITITPNPVDAGKTFIISVDVTDD